MILAALFFVASLQHSEPIDTMSGRSSEETERLYVVYVECLARRAEDLSSDAGWPEARMQRAKSACRTNYDSFVASVVRDSDGLPGASSAAARARALLDAIDARVVLELSFQPSPATLAELPVRRMVGTWRLGNGPLAVRMTVRFEPDGSLVGILTPPQEYTANGLKNWRVVSDGTREAVLHASFDDGSSVTFERIPSFPSEMDFINPTAAIYQRFDLEMEDEDLLISVATPDSGEQLRFTREVGTAPSPTRD